MHLTLAIPGLLWQDIGDIEYIYPNLDTPNLNALLKQCSINQLDFSYSDFIYALDKRYIQGSLARQIAIGLGVSSDYQNFLLAEPTHLRLDRDRLLICEPQLLQLTCEESQAAIDTLNRHFNAELRAYYINENLWLIGHNTDISEHRLYPIIDILGENIDEYLPSLALNKIINEVQMLLYNTPAAESREGLLPLNSIWLWDKSISKQSDYAKIYTNNPEILYNTASPLPENTESAFADNNLILLDNLYTPSAYRDSFGYADQIAALDKNLVPHLMRWQKQGHKLTLLIPGRDKTLQINLNRNFKFWRKYQLIDIARKTYADK